MSEEKLQFIYTLEAVDPAKAQSQDTWTEYDAETFNLHWANLEPLKAERKLILAGRAQDGVGPAIVILEVDSEAEAQEIFEREPFVTRGFARATLHPYQVAISRNEI